MDGATFRVPARLSKCLSTKGNERQGTAGIDMATGDNRFALRALALGFAAGTLMFGLIDPASAGIFDNLFGSVARPVEAASALPASVQSYAEPSSPIRRESHPAVRHAERGFYSAQCVRTCDGYHFPVHAAGNISAGEMCQAFCPGSRTQVYSGSDIKYAVSANGSRYSDLDTAFLYRKRLVAGCTCNGHDSFGLAHIDVSTDPTLRPGDVVATKHGVMAVTGTRNRTADFTPIQSDRGMAKSYRDKLSELKILPPNPGARQDTPVTLPLADNARRVEDRRAQLDR